MNFIQQKNGVVDGFGLVKSIEKKLEKITKVLAIAFFVITLGTTVYFMFIK